MFWPHPSYVQSLPFTQALQSPLYVEASQSPFCIGTLWASKFVRKKLKGAYVYVCV